MSSWRGGEDRCARFTVFAAALTRSSLLATGDSPLVVSARAVAQFKQPDFTRGDPNTLAGYMAVHDRPAAFEGSDGFSYSVEIMTDETGDPSRPWAGYLFFVRYRQGDPVASGHVETDYLRFGDSEEAVRTLVGAMQLNDAVAELNKAIAAKSSGARAWWDVMREEDAQ